MNMDDITERHKILNARFLISRVYFEFQSKTRLFMNTF
jgi:hypothetical protein